MSADYPSMTTAEIRSKFLNFFEERGLKLYPSSSLVPDDPSLLLANAGMNQFKEYYPGKKTMKEIGADKPMLIYIISYFFYIDGVHTIISMSTSYGTNLGLDSAGMLLALLLVQVLGLPFCLLYMKLAARFGARTMVGVGICVYMFICIFAYFMNSLWQFWMLAVLCATSQGGIQALSRSMFGKLIPDKARSGEFFGFFDIFGKFSSILGPTLVGAVSAFAASKMMAAQGLTAVTATAEQVDAINKAASPYGILSVILIIIAGAVLYFAVLPRTLKGDQRKI